MRRRLLEPIFCFRLESIGCATSFTGIIDCWRGLRLFDGRDGGVVALLAVGESDGGGDLGAGHVLKELEVLFRRIFVAGGLQSAGERELRGRVERLNGEGLLQHLDGFVELLEFAVADAFEVVGIDIAWVEFDRVSESS